MNPRDELLQRLIRENKSDEEITAALAQFDAAPPRAGAGLPSAAPVDQGRPQEGQGAVSLAQRIGRDLTTPKKWAQAALAGLDVAGMGLGDEVMSAFSTAPGTFEEKRQRARKYLNKANDESGWMGDMAQIGGAVLGPGATGAAIAGRIPAKAVGSSLLRQLLGGAVAGGAMGGVGGAASAEPGDRVRSGLVGMGTGATLGAAIPAIAAGGRAFARYTGSLKARPDELTSAALQKAVKQSGIKTSGNTTLTHDPDTFEWAARQSRANVPDDMRVIDLSPETQTLGKDAARSSSVADKSLQDLAERRIAEQPGALEGDVNDALGLVRREHADEVSRKLMEKISADDEAALAPIWARHQAPIDDPAVLGAWQDIRSELGGIPASVESRQVLSRAPDGAHVTQATRNIPERPNLRAVHEAKVSLQKMISAIAEAPKNAQNVSSADALQLGALQAAKDRLAGIDLSGVPGGPEYLAQMAKSARERLVNDQLSVGKKLGGALSKTPWENVRNQTQDIADAAIGGQPVDATTQRRALGALRKGVASNIRDQARGEGGGALLGKLETQNVQENLVPLQAGRNVNANDVRDQFAQRMRDRRSMATTNMQQARIQPQELLEGAKAKGTALGFQEAGGLTGRVGAIKTAFGALGGKALSARRNTQLALSAEQISELLQRYANDASNPTELFERAMLGKMLQQARIREQGRAAGAVGGLLSQHKSTQR